MKIVRARDYTDMSRKAANIISAQVILKPNCVLGLATGDSPIGTYDQLIDWYKKGDVDFSEVSTYNLDEYFGIADDDPQSYHYFMNKHFFDHINIDPKNVHVPAGSNTDVDEVCASFDKMVADAGFCDLQLLGIGRNGHIGFNEPDDVFSKGTHCVNLTESTIEANSRLFEREEDVPRRAYTMGVQTIMNARSILVVANGEKKAQAVHDMCFGPVTPQCPASILQLHTNVTIVADDEALALCKDELA
ncbi:MAG: glucosamine-6-phosphate deaminase [Collinsella bouchesdurhonensis]|nr:glucosamine-6-phosphate deaminase [Collinsella bouchesdurhonensis]MCI5785773.1 glucosamine-6-phosphate deaminase [Collinsella bouchesdurhonensis]MDY3052911.1 glucosamine-6-phosphate deaminase [Collinsella bouchesdurhonensis]MEE0279721.1 glucosamine-6-phosphate deaminase [Collinsella bouchesdurhonensis]